MFVLQGLDKYRVNDIIFFTADVRIDAELALWKEAVNLQGKKIVGTTINTMLNQPCRSEECPLGNFATDAMLYNVRMFKILSSRI